MVFNDKIRHVIAFESKKTNDTQNKVHREQSQDKQIQSLWELMINWPRTQWRWLPLRQMQILDKRINAHHGIRVRTRNVLWKGDVNEEATHS